MKHILTIIFLIITITACQRHSNVYDCLVNADSLIDKNKDSAAIRQLLTINKSDLKTDEERAYYGLLHDMATYRLMFPVESDSGITYSVAYYRKTANKYNLARALYYKGMISFRNNNINVALTCLKEAEHLALKVNDAKLLSRIYANLGAINTTIGNQNTALHYEKKALALAEKRKDWALTCLILDKIGNICTSLNMLDSGAYYTEKSIPLVKYLREEEKVDVLTDISAEFSNQGKLSKAEKYAKMSLSIKPTSYAYYILGNIYLAQEKESEAFVLWDKAMSKGSPEVKAEMMSWMADIKKEQGEYREAAELMTKSKAMKDSIEQSKNTEKMLSLQNEIDKAEAARQADMKLKTAAAAATVAVAALALLLVVHRRKINRSKKRLGEIERLTDRYRKEIDELSLSKDENERKIGSLSRKLDTLREQRAAIIGLGQRRYEEIIGGGNTAEWKKADFEAAVEYGRTLMPEDIAAIEKSHRRLTPYNTFFLMLPLAGLSDSDIQRAMNMTAGAVRTMRYRLKNNSARNSTRE